MKLIFIFLLSAVAFAQPDTPSAVHREAVAVKPCGWSGCWDYSHPNLTVGQTFRSPHFLIPTLTADAAYAADAWQSRRAIDRGCIESNTDLPARATAGDYAVNWVKVELPMDVLQWALAKLNRRMTNYFVIGMASARVTVHMKGVATAMGCR